MPRTFLIGSLLCLAAVSAGAAPAEPTPAVRRVALADPAMAATAQARMDLKYLASCALGADTVLVADADGEHYEFPGSGGLAPAWQERALTADEERWVSACVLARTNYFGVRVELSLRSPFPTAAPMLQVLEEERTRFPVEEATFFGNVFAAQSVAYTCGGNDAAARKTQIAAHKRICALPLDQRLADGRQFTACGFIDVGACTPEHFVQDGVDYRQAVTVYLPAVPRQ